MFDIKNSVDNIIIKEFNNNNNNNNNNNSVYVKRTINNLKSSNISKTNNNFNKKSIFNEIKFNYDKFITIRKDIGLFSNDNYSSNNYYNTEKELTLKDKLRDIFVFYCQFGNKLNFKYLNSANFYKFCKDANIESNFMNKTKLELIFVTNYANKLKDAKNINELNNDINKIYTSNINNFKRYSYTKKESKSFIIFDEFLSIITKIAEYEVVNSNNNKNNNNIHDNIVISKDKLITCIKEYIELKINYLYLKLVSNKTLNLKYLLGEDKCDCIIINDNLIDNICLLIISECFNVFYDIYINYFKTELSLSFDGTYIKETSTKVLYDFLNEFDICPELISKKSVVNILELIINSFDSLKLLNIINNKLMNMLIYKIDNNCIIYDKLYTSIESNKDNNIVIDSYVFGKYITIYHFILLLINFANISYNDNCNSSSINNNYNNNNNTNLTNNLEKSNINNNNYTISLGEKLCIFIEKIELSSGYKNINIVCNKMLPKKIISYEVIKRIENNNSNNIKLLRLSSLCNTENLNNNYTNKNQLIIKGRSNEENSILNNSQKLNLNNFFQYIEVKNKEEFNNLYGILKAYKNELNTIFTYYCEYGDVTNAGEMNNFKFNKFLKESNLISNSLNQNKNVFKQQEVDIIFIKLVNLKLDYNNFQDIINTSSYNYKNKDEYIFSSRKEISCNIKNNNEYNSNNNNNSNNDSFKYMPYINKNLKNIFNQNYKNSFHQSSSVLTSINSYNTRAVPFEYNYNTNTLRNNKYQSLLINNNNLRSNSYSNSSNNIRLIDNDNLLVFERLTLKKFNNSNNKIIYKFGSNNNKTNLFSSNINIHSNLNFYQFVIGLEIILELILSYNIKLEDISIDSTNIKQYFNKYLYTPYLLKTYNKIIDRKSNLTNTGFIKRIQCQNKQDLIINVLKDIDPDVNYLVKNILPEAFWILFQLYSDKEFLNRHSSKSYVSFENEYSTSSLKMNFSGFFQFTCDFEIFPLYVSKAKLIRYFKFIINNNNNNNNNNNILKQNNEITIWSFSLLVSQIAFDLPYEDPQPNPVFKIIRLIEKMTLSKGKKKLYDMYGINKIKYNNDAELLLLIKDKYSKHLKNKYKKNSDKNILSYSKLDISNSIVKNLNNHNISFKDLNI